MPSNKKPVKYYCLDIGNVILDTKFDCFLNLMSSIMGISPQLAWDFLVKIQVDHDLGYTTIRDSLERIYNPKLSNIDIERLVLEWNKTIQLNNHMKSFIVSILDSNIKNVALLSNIGEEHGSIMRSVITEEIFDRCIPFFSYEVGARKPHKLYYKTFLDMYPQFNNATYLDDRIENIEAGKTLGLNSIEFALDRFSSPDELQLALDNIKGK